jgi:hypothetical protein
MRAMSWDLWVDFQRADNEGLTRGNVRHVRSGVDLQGRGHDCGWNEDAEPGVAEVLELGDRGFALLRVFPGSVDENRHRLGGGRTPQDQGRQDP